MTASAPRRGSAFVGPATAQRPRRRRSHDLCEGCGHFRSEHTSGNDCRRDGCPCQVMGWTPPPPVRQQSKMKITDEVKLQMESLLQSGMNYRKVAATIGCSITTVKNYFPGYGDNARADIEANREVFKYYMHRRIEIETRNKERKQ